jgi:steroid delta-isomerase-like uncharacterized protein
MLTPFDSSTLIANTQSQQEDQKMSTEQNKAVVRRFHELFDQGNLNAIESLLSPDMRAYMAGTPGNMDFTGFKQLGEMFLNAFSQSHMIIEQQIAEGDKVATCGTWQAVHTGDFQGIPATGQAVQIPIFVVDRFVNDKILEHWAYFDTMTLMQQLGVIPSPERG